MFVHGGELTVYPHVEEKALLSLQFRKGLVTLTAGRYVGFIPLSPRIAVDVRPKLPVSNLARVLDLAGTPIGALAGADRSYSREKLPSRSITLFLLANLTRAIQPLSEHGIWKSYVRVARRTSTPSGRINVSSTLKTCLSRGMRHHAVAERFLLTSDTPANRVIRAALTYLLSVSQRDEASLTTLSNANRALNLLPEEIGSIQPGDIDIVVNTMRNQALPKNRLYYSKALDIATLVLQGRSIGLDRVGDDLIMETFIVDFEDIFEKYIRKVLHLASGPDLLVLDGNVEGKKPLFDDRNDPPAQPDIILSRPTTNESVVVEVKYKDKPDRSDINQAITYAVAYRCDRVVLAHQCKANGPRGLRRLGVVNGITVDAYAFDLGRQDLEAEEQAFAVTVLGMMPPVGQMAAA
ncbi:5-methylcytosine-specific restriction enzyme subunit McrC [Brevundimonas sp. 1080]|uniref:5-methylcytosine restriction system specificity protein McrC n=1 Tax=Brevundimonas sp. 1080 TaxID=3156405 RepID=UPI0033910B5B